MHISTVPFRKYPGCIKEGARCMQTILHLVKIAASLRSVLSSWTVYAAICRIVRLGLHST